MKQSVEEGVLLWMEISEPQWISARRDERVAQLQPGQLDRKRILKVEHGPAELGEERGGEVLAGEHLQVRLTHLGIQVNGHV